VNTTCGIVKDLLPLYIDGVCSEDSRALVEAHLAECPECSMLYQDMRSDEERTKTNEQDTRLTEGLNRLKSRFDRRMMIGIACALLAALAVFIGINALNTYPLKELGPEDISVSAQVYSIDDLRVLQVDDDAESNINKGLDDAGEMFTVLIPDMSNMEISMTADALDETEYITVIDWNCPYHIRNISWTWSVEDEGTLYVESIKTSFLNNKASGEFRSFRSIEMKKISRIVCLGSDDSETIIWQDENTVS